MIRKLKLARSDRIWLVFLYAFFQNSLSSNCFQQASGTPLLCRTQHSFALLSTQLTFFFMLLCLFLSTCLPSDVALSLTKKAQVNNAVSSECQGRKHIRWTIFSPFAYQRRQTMHCCKHIPCHECPAAAQHLSTMRLPGNHQWLAQTFHGRSIRSILHSLQQIM